MHEHHLTIARTARYYTLGPSEPRTQLWFALHGYAQLAGRFLRALAPLDDGLRTIVAPEALSRFYLEAGVHGPESRVGATWMTREDRLSEINDYVGYLDALYEVLLDGRSRDEVDVRVLGFSQGAATACRWVTLGHVRPDRLYLWGGFVPPDLDLAQAADPLRAASLTVVLGRHDEYATPERRAEQERRLRTHGVQAHVVEYDGGHRIHAETLASLAAG